MITSARPLDETPRLSPIRREATLVRVHCSSVNPLRRAMRRALPLLLAAAACTNPSPPAEPPSAPPPADGPGPERPDGADFASPPTTPSPAPDAVAAQDPALNTRIRERYGAPCRLERVCGELLGVDCNAAADGPYYYVRRSDLEIVSRCGGECMGGNCTNCPPVEWTCPTY